MIKNFTPFFTKLSKYKPDPAVSLLSSIFIIAVMVVGFNQFSKQLASANCSTQSDINSMVETKSSIESQLSSIDSQIRDNNNNVVSIQESLVTNHNNINSISSQLSLYSDYYLEMKKKSVDERYSTYMRAKSVSRKNKSKTSLDLLDRMIASYKTTYENTLNNYNDLILKRDALKQQLVDLDNEKMIIETQVASADAKTLELEALRADVQTQLDSINSSLESAYNNMCPTSEINCNDGMDDDKDGGIDCSDSDCSSNTACNTTGCLMTGCPAGQVCNTTSGSCDIDQNCPGGCSAGYTCSAGSCVPDTTGCSVNGCSQGQVCVNNECVSDGSCSSDGDCSSGQVCNSGKCEEGEGKSKEICDDIALVDEDGNGRSNCSDFYNCFDEALCCIDRADNDSDWLIDDADPDCRGDNVEVLCPDIANHADEVAKSIKALITNKADLLELPVSAFIDDINNTYDKAAAEKEKALARQNANIEAACKEYQDYLDDIPQSSWDNCPGLFRIDTNPCS
jgi:peptidoglycan hydrolase CwlO-like protein